MKAIILHCKPSSRFHLGKYAPDRDSDTALADTDEIIHSDTLFAALANNWNDSIGNADELVALFSSGQLSISSGYHCIESPTGVFTWFLPKPISFNLFQPEGGADYKHFRKISYISAGIWQQIASPGSITAQQDIIIIDKRFALLASEVKPLEDTPATMRQELAEKLKICSTATLPKVEVRNDLPDSRIYQFSVTEIADNAKYLPGLKVHYYFLLQTNGDLPAETRQKIDLAINLLQYNGIGAERSTIGHFENISTVQNWTLQMKSPHPTMACSIGLFNPQQATDIYLGKPILRGGRRLGAQGRQWLKTVRMVQEGAIIGNNATGMLASVKPDDKNAGPFLRNGTAFTLPVHQNWIP